MPATVSMADAIVILATIYAVCMAVPALISYILGGK